MLHSEQSPEKVGEFSSCRYVPGCSVNGNDEFGQAMRERLPAIAWQVPPAATGFRRW